VAAKTIYPAGSDHLHGLSDHLQKGGTYCIPVWKEQEIFDAIPHMIGEDQKQALLDSSPHQSLEPRAKKMTTFATGWQHLVVRNEIWTE